MRRHNMCIEQRPWGSFTILDEQEFCKVKKIEVKPNAKLSLQSHTKRAECWTVVSGIGIITLDKKEISLSTGQTINIAIGQKHRMRNDSNTPLVFIEVQTGSYFGEDDIIRYQDDYGRVQ